MTPLFTLTFIKTNISKGTRQMYTTVTLQDLLDKGVTWNNIAGVWEETNGVCYSLLDKDELDKVECEILPGCIGEYLAARDGKADSFEALLGV